MVDAPLALTLTAELSDVFRTKSEGVLCVLDAVRAAFPWAPVYALRLDEHFVPLEEARRHPASSPRPTGWRARSISRRPRVLPVDRHGLHDDRSDPDHAGRVAVEGRTDPARLTSGELVYTGAQRTPLGAVAAHVPLRGRPCRTAPEFFATMADVHLALGHITADAYTSPTADGRPATQKPPWSASSRAGLRRRRDDQPGRGPALARAFSEAQLTVLSHAVLQVRSRFAAEPSCPSSAAAAALPGPRRGPRLRLPLLDLGATCPPDCRGSCPATRQPGCSARHLRSLPRTRRRPLCRCD